MVTDNASSETTSWDLIRKEEKKEDILCTGCTVHACNLLFKDVIQKHKWSNDIVEKCNALVTFLRSHNWILSSIREKAKLTVTYHCSTRFAGNYYTMHRLKRLKGTIRTVLTSDEYEDKNFKGGDKFFELVVNNEFWLSVGNLLAFLKPLKRIIRKLDSDRHMSEHVFPLMGGLMTTWNDAENFASNVPPRFRTHAVRELAERWDWLEFDIHRAAYCLSPYYHKDDVSSNRELNASVNEVILAYTSQIDSTLSQCTADFSRFKEHPTSTGIFPVRAHSLHSSSAMTSYAWWKLHGSM